VTRDGKDILSRADVIIYDYLANEIFLEYAKPQAELIYVGKKGGDHTMGQAEINRLIVEKIALPGSRAGTRSYSVGGAKRPRSWWRTGCPSR